MTKNLRPLRARISIMLWALCLVYCTYSKAAQLSGNYTINPALPATTTNFQDLASAVNFLTSATARPDAGPSNSTPFGVSASVTFTISAATYTLSSELVIPAVTGTSATKTVTFSGTDASSCVITGSASAAALVRLNLCSYVTLQNLTIINTFSGARSGVAIIGNTSATTAGSGCSIKKCIISLPNSPGSDGYGICVTGTANGSNHTANRAQDIVLDSNTISGGSYGIAILGGNNVSYNANINIRGNVINNTYTYGIYLQAIGKGVNVSGNKISLSTANNSINQYGIHMYRCLNTGTSGSASHQIIGNTIKNSNYYGISYDQCTNTATYVTKIHNNMIAGGFRGSATNYGIHSNGSSTYNHFVEIYHNSVLMDNASTTCRGLHYANTATGTGVVKNNIFACIGTGAAAIPAYFSTDPSGSPFDYNNYYNQNGVNLVYRSGNHTVADYNTASTGGDHSVSEDPRFSRKDLHLSNGCAVKGTNLLTSVPFDLDGNSRNATPDMGCDEFMMKANDLAVDELLSPLIPIAAGQNDVEIRVKNVGSNAISTGLEAGYIHNGMAIVPEVITTALAPCSTITVKFTTQANIVFHNTLSIYTSKPNQQQDDNTSNDTLDIEFLSSLSGTFTVGGSSPDFNTLADAIAALRNGVSGPVTFLIAPGTYNGQVVIEGNISGASPTNTITFDGGDAALCSITASVAGTAAVLLRNTSYVYFRNVNISNTNTTACAGFAFAGTNKNCGISTSVINMFGGVNNQYGIIMTGTVAGNTLTNNASDSIIIDSNTVNNAYSGIYVYGNTGGSAAFNKGINIRGNTVSRAIKYGLYVTNIYNAVMVLNNKVIMDSIATSAATSNVGIIVSNCSNISGIRSHEFTGNYVRNARSTSISLNALNGSLSNPDKIYNNVVDGVLAYNGKVTGLSVSNTENGVSEIYHNTIYIDSAVSATAADQAALDWSGSIDSKIKNNILIQGDKNAQSIYPLFVQNTITSGNVDYNLYYNAASEILVYNTGDIYTADNFKTDLAGGAGSIHAYPPFVNAANRDLHITSSCLTGANLLSRVPAFFDGSNRTSSLLGAYPALPVANDLASIAMVQPDAQNAFGYNDLVFRVQNMGSNPITAFMAGYIHNNGSPVVQSWTGILNTCDTVSIPFIGAQQINMGISDTITTFVYSANGYVTDDHVYNDTLKVLYVKRGLSGTYTIGGASADYPDFTSARNALYSDGIIGPVIFNVEPGTYNEQLNLGSTIAGLSATNTITFNGTDAATCILTFSSNNASQKHTVKIGQSYISLRNLTIESASSTYGWIVHIANTNLTGIQVKNCVLRFTHADIRINPSEDNIAIIASTHTQTFRSGNSIKVDDLEIDSNVFEYGYAAFAIDNDPASSPAVSSLNNKFRGNMLKGINTYGVYIANSEGSEIMDNTIAMNEAAGFGTGIYLQNNVWEISGITGFNIAANRIYGARNGIVADAIVMTTGSKGLIANNSISRFASGDGNGIYLSQCFNVAIWHNSVRFNQKASSGNNGAINIAAGAGPIGAFSLIDVRNNNFIIDSVSPACPAYFENGTVARLDNNNYYKPDASGNFIMVNGTWFTPQNFVGGGGHNALSLSVDPLFASDSLLTMRRSCIKGSALLMPYDITGKQRSVRPDIGAYENESTQNEIGTVAVLSPGLPVLPGLQNISVLVKNYGSLAISSTNVGYIHNNNVPVIQTWTGNLLPCDTVAVVFSGAEQVNMQAGSINTLKVFTDSPNNLLDSVSSNDTVEVSFSAPLNGTYTIGGTLPDFADFAAATDALNNGGISGSVVFNVRSGTYNEAVMIRKVAGASAIHTITFQAESGVATDVILSFTGSAPNPATVTLADADFINLKKMTITALDPGYGQVIRLTGTSSADTIENCILNTVVAFATSTGLAVIYTESYSGSDVVIRNNSIKNGSYAIYLQSASATASNHIVIQNNTINNAYYRSIEARYAANLEISGNTIIPSTYSAHYAVATFNCDSALTITNNIITMIAGGYGISGTDNNGFAGKEALIANNAISIGGTGPSEGIAYLSSAHARIINNTVIVSGNSNAQAYAARFNNNIQVSDLVLQNNVFANTGGGAALYEFSLRGNVSDYNLLYSSGPVLFKYDLPASSYSNLETWRNSSFQDQHSVSYLPSFTSAGDLTPDASDSASWALNGKGIYNALVPADINEVYRADAANKGVPDIGAYEFTPVTLPPLAIAVPDSIAPHQLTDTIQVFLFGSDTVATIKWKAYSEIPKLKVRQYPGVMPDQVNPSLNYMFFYVDIEATGSGFYNYDINVHYRNNWTGTNPDEKDIRLTNRHDLNPWTLVTNGSIDTARNIISGQYLYSFSQFSGTDLNNPMPVKLISFKGAAQKNDVLLLWSTASETNSKGFEVQRSIDGKSFKTIAFVKGKGNTELTSTYSFNDKNILSTQKSEVFFYRLKQVDLSGLFSYSDVVSVNNRQIKPGINYTLYPNPFSREVNLHIEVAEPGLSSIEVFDMTGKIIWSKNMPLETGTSVIALPDLDILERGVYFVSVNIAGDKKVTKLVRQ